MGANVHLQAFVTGLQHFPGGPELIPAEGHPRLPVDWSIHFWLGLEDPLAKSPRQQLIIRQHLAKGSSDLTCWALYCMVTICQLCV